MISCCSYCQYRICVMHDAEECLCGVSTDIYVKFGSIGNMDC